MTNRLLACVLVAGTVGPAGAAPVPKASVADPVLARVVVENVGSALAQPALRKELALTAEQDKKLAALSADFEQKLAKASGPEVVIGPFDATQQVDMFKNIAVTVAEFDASAVKLLTDAQHRRLRQVQLQKGGPAALLGRHAVRALALTAEQEDAMATELSKYKRAAIVTEELLAMTSEAMFDTGMDTIPAKGEQANEELKRLAAYFEKDAAEQEKVRQAMLKSLTAEQRATWAELTGKPVAATDLLRAGSMFGDARVVKAMTKSHTIEGVPPPAGQPVPIPPPPPPGQLPPVAPPPAQFPPPGK